MIHLLFSVLIFSALCFALTNGLIDGGGLVSPVITTRAMEPLPALLLVAVCEVTGLLLLGHQVAYTVARDLVRFPQTLTSTQLLIMTLAALGGALGWNISMWRIGFPSSSTHALMGGLAGAVLAQCGPGSVHWMMFARVFLFLALVPVLGVLFSFTSAKLIRWIGAYLTPVVRPWLRWLQIGALAGTAMVHGSNDGQKSVGLIALSTLALSGSAGAAAIPTALWWACGLALASGVLFGSRRTIRTVGRGFYRVETLEGFCAETSAMCLVGISSFAGYPMSTSHVMSTSVLGAGVAVQPRGVRWTLVSDLALAWLITVPAAGLVAAFIIRVLEWFHVVP